MFDFPNSPVPGQILTGPGGIEYRWDGVKWVNTTDTGKNYLPLTGGTLLGPLTLSRAPLAILEAATKGYVDTISNSFVGRNLLHNSLFNIAQRGVGTFASGYTLDRWRMDLTLDTFSVAQQQYIDSQRAIIGDEQANNVLVAAVVGNAGASAFSLLSQNIEDVRRTAGKTISISFWAHCTAGTLKVGIGMRQHFGSGGAPSALVDVAASSITITTTPTRYSVTVAMPSISSKTLGSNNDSYTRLGLYLSAGANTNTQAGGIGVQSGTFVFWGVQLEIGSVASPLEKPDPQQDLAKCQRFYQTGQIITGGYAPGAAQDIYWSSLLPVVLRATPTIVPTGATMIGAGTLSAGSYSSAAIWFNAKTTGAGQFAAGASFTASADL